MATAVPYEASKNDSETGFDNPSFMRDPTDKASYSSHLSIAVPKMATNGSASTALKQDDEVSGGEEIRKRQQYSKPIEFLLTSIATSVGLGNIWRLPFAAYENGGGAFLIPYLIVLVFIGRPLYFMELSLGQFSSYGCGKIWSLSPIFKGIAGAQVVAGLAVSSYYSFLIGLSLYYIGVSFAKELPWTKCDPKWADENCFDSRNSTDDFNITDGIASSAAEEYYRNHVLKMKSDIEDGLGSPDLTLLACLVIAWIAVGGTLIKGVKTSGKASYVTALFPYAMLIILLIQGSLLPGAKEGILFFLRPKWSSLMDPNVWLAAVTQSFFSLTVGYGGIIMNASYNRFSHDVYRDALILSVLDTITSLIAGLTIFAVLGSLALRLNTEIDHVVKSGMQLAFVSYPEAISHFKFVPQAFSVAFFVMIFTLGVGSCANVFGNVVIFFRDQFPKLKQWTVVCALASMELLVGLMYCTPGGQHILTLVDYYGATFIIYFAAIFTVVGVNWIYGINNFCLDVKFMIGRVMSIFYKFCVAFLIPVSLVVILTYSCIQLKPLMVDDKELPKLVNACGWIMVSVGLIQIPIWAVHSSVKADAKGFFKKIFTAFQATEKWGPRDSVTKRQWVEFKRINRKK